MKDMVFYDESGGGVTFSGGEPLMQQEFLEVMLRGCRDAGIRTAVDTSGHAQWEDFERILPWTDLFLYDLKLMDDAEHLVHVGVHNTRIQDNLTMLDRLDANIVVRVPLIPGVTDTHSNLDEIGVFVRGLINVREVHLLPYNPIGESKHDRLHGRHRYGPHQTQPDEVLEDMKNRVASAGVTVRIGG
jgi:pyruvate formate lyase activating enzyme